MQVAGDALPGPIRMLLALDMANPEEGGAGRLHQLMHNLDVITIGFFASG
jgi:hypothetical protein